MKKILIVEDDRTLAGSLYSQLSKKYVVSLAASEDELYSRIQKNRFDVIVADRILNSFDTQTIVGYLREQSTNTKLICISQLSSLTDRVKGLELGFDDYLPKPFSSRELELKIQKLINFQRVISTECINLGNILFYPENGKLQIADQATHLRRKEFEIFNYLITHRNKVVTREKLFNAAWSEDKLPSNVTLDVYIRKIRVKLLDYASILKTVRGYGYVLTCEKAE